MAIISNFRYDPPLITKPLHRIGILVNLSPDIIICFYSCVIDLKLESEARPMINQANQPTSFDSVELHASCHSQNSDIQTAAYKTLWAYLYSVALQIVYDQPEAGAMAQDCAQIAMVRIHQHLAECREPAAFRTWARRIVSHIAIDELRRRKRLLPALASESDTLAIDTPLGDFQSSPDAVVMKNMRLRELRSLIAQAPISDRSRRVALGRYLDDTPDETLAQVESELSGRPVRPSHIQVTRSKNMVKLRNWEPLHSFWKKTNQ